MSLFEDIEQACVGLFYKGAEVHAFQAPQSVKTLTAESFLTAINQGPLTPIEEIDFNEFFETLIANDPQGEQWDNLYQLLLSRLADRAAKRVFRVAGVDLYAVGLYYPESQPIRVIGIKTIWNN